MPKIKPNPKLFINATVGRTAYKPLEHKDGRQYDDVDYFELLGRKCEELDKQNPYKNVPTDYGQYDRDVVNVAKQVCKAIDDGTPRNEIQMFLNRCIDLNN